MTLSRSGVYLIKTRRALYSLTISAFFKKLKHQSELIHFQWKLLKQEFRTNLHWSGKRSVIELQTRCLLSCKIESHNQSGPPSNCSLHNDLDFYHCHPMTYLIWCTKDLIKIIFSRNLATMRMSIKIKVTLAWSIKL